MRASAYALRAMFLARASRVRPQFGVEVDLVVDSVEPDPDRLSTGLVVSRLPAGGSAQADSSLHRQCDELVDKIVIGDARLGPHPGIH